MKKEKLDYSNTCNMDDDDVTNPCWECKYFLFPIGCMKDEDEDESDYITITESED